MPDTLGDAAAAPAPPDIDEAGVDRAQIRAMLELSPDDRLRLIEEYVDSMRVIREANETGPVR